MGSAETSVNAFRTAMKSGSFAFAMNAARDIDLNLADALALTILAAKKSPEMFEPMAVRWTARMSVLFSPSLHELSWVLERLRDVKEGRAQEAAEPLAEFVRKRS